MSSVVAEPILYLHVREAAWKAVDFGRGVHQVTGLPLRAAGLLRPGQKAVTVLAVDSSSDELVVANGTINTGAQYNDNDGVTGIKADEGVLFHCTPSVVGSYTVTVIIRDDSTPTANEIPVDVPVVVMGQAAPAP